MWEMTSTVDITSDNPRGGLNLHFDLISDTPLQKSESWLVAGRTLQFFKLGPHEELNIEAGCHYLKVVIGKLENLNLSCFAPPFSRRKTRFDGGLVVAGDKGALFALVSETNDTPEKIRSIDQMQFNGPDANFLGWQSFADKFGTFTDWFDGQDCYMADGIHLLDQSGAEIVYVNFWACGKGVDLSTHNHANDPSPLAPAFAEVHWVIDAGTDTSGMFRTEGPDHPKRIRQYLSRGEEHGPYFEIDEKRGRPMLRENGAVMYGWHGWEAGADLLPDQAYDFVFAFEINPDFADL